MECSVCASCRQYVPPSVRNRVIYLLLLILSDSPKQQLTVSQLRSLLSGYDVLSCRLKSRKGGSVAVIARQNLDVKLNVKSSFTSFESMDLSVRVGWDTIHVIVVYRPPSSKKNTSTTVHSSLNMERYSSAPPFLQAGSLIFETSVSTSEMMLIAM